jgi:hypothetical protein
MLRTEHRRQIYVLIARLQDDLGHRKVKFYSEHRLVTEQRPFRNARLTQPSHLLDAVSCLSGTDKHQVAFSHCLSRSRDYHLDAYGRYTW